MIDSFSNIYNRIENKNLFLAKIGFYSLSRFIVRTMANVILPIWFRCTQNNPKYQLAPTGYSEGRLIVSFTSFPKRIGKLWMVVESILRQSIKPDKLVLWLSKEQFSTLEELPDSLLKLQKRGLQIILCDGDIRSHKKYYYAMKQYPNDTIITIDDDILYPTDLLSSLVSSSNLFKDTIICRYARKINWRHDELLSYSTWEQYRGPSEPRIDLFFGSGGGTLFPKHLLHTDVLNIELALNLTLYADDIWLNTMMRLNNISLCFSKGNHSMLPIQYKSNLTLYSVNCVNGENDKQIQAIRKYYIKEIGKDPFEKNR